MSFDAMSGLNYYNLIIYNLFEIVGDSYPFISSHQGRNVCGYSPIAYSRKCNAI